MNAGEAQALTAEALVLMAGWCDESGWLPGPELRAAVARFAGAVALAERRAPSAPEPDDGVTVPEPEPEPRRA